MKIAPSPKAKQDIDEIWTYSADHWSIAQADIYVVQIRKTIKGSGKDANAGRVHPSRGRTYRKINVGSHVVFYRHSDDLLLIVHILHKRMDVNSHI